MSLKLDESDEMVESINRIEDNLEYIEKKIKNITSLNSKDIENRIIDTEKEINYIKTELSCLPPSYTKKYNTDKYSKKLLQLKSNLQCDNCQVQIKELDANEEAKHALIKSKDNKSSNKIKDEIEKQINLNEKKEIKKIIYIVIIIVILSILLFIVKII